MPVRRIKPCQEVAWESREYIEDCIRDRWVLRAKCHITKMVARIEVPSMLAACLFKVIAMERLLCELCDGCPNCAKMDEEAQK